MFAVNQENNAPASMTLAGLQSQGDPFNQINAFTPYSPNSAPAYLGGGSETPLSIPSTGFGGPLSGPSANPAALTSNPLNPSGLQPTSQYNGANWNPTYQSNPGYNPSQYATLDTANTLAGGVGSGLGLGANVRQTQNAPGSPIGPPPQLMLDFGGADPLNAGLLAERYGKYDHATADRMTRDELALMGPRQAPGEGSYGSQSMFGPSAGGNQNLGGGQNIGQFVGERKGAGFGSPGVSVPQPPASGILPNGNAFPGRGYGRGGRYGSGGGSGGYPQQSNRPLQFGNRANYGGFGAANQFQGANQGAQLQQLMQMLLGGRGGTLQTRNRQSPFQAGNMSDFAGMLNGNRGGGQSFNPYSNGINYGGGSGTRGYYPQYR